MTINTYNVYTALSHYSKFGFMPTQVPMLIQRDISEMYKPEGRVDLPHGDTGLVYAASAEQGILQQMRTGCSIILQS
jgi:hypothetical protein